MKTSATPAITMAMKSLIQSRAGAFSSSPRANQTAAPTTINDRASPIHTMPATRKSVTARGCKLGLMQVVFAVEDLARSLEFYERAFGWRRNGAIDYTNYVELLPPDGGALGLFERDGFAGLVGAEPAGVPQGRVSPAYLYVRVEDAEAAAHRLEAAGGRRVAALEPRSWGETAAWFADPDGNLVAVAERTRAAAATRAG